MSMQWWQRRLNRVTRGPCQTRSLVRLFLGSLGVLAINGSAIVAIAQLSPSPAGASPSVVCTWTDASGNGLVSVADNWSPTSSCGGTSQSADSATLTAAQLVFPATVPSGGGSPVIDETLSIDSIVLDNAYALTTPSATGSETLTLTPTSTPAVGIADTTGNSSIIPSTTTLTIDVANAQEWAVATGSVLTDAAPLSGSFALFFGDSSNRGQVVLDSDSPAFAGQFTIASSSVQVETAFGLGVDDAVTLSGTSPQLLLDNTGTPFTLADSLTLLGSNPTVTDESGDTLGGSLSVATSSTDIFLDASATAPFTISSSITGGPSTLKTESSGGDVVLDGSNSLPALTSCAVWAASGTTQLALGAAFPSGCSLNVSLGAAFDLNGFSITTGDLTDGVAGLVGAGTITNNGSAPATVTDDGSADSFTGGIDNGTNTVALAVSGSGANLQISGTSTYSGGTTVGDGAILAGGGPGSSDPFGTGGVVVDNGGTLTMNSAFNDGVVANSLALGVGSPGTATLLDAEGTGASYWSGGVTLDGTNSVASDSTGNLVLDGGIAGSSEALTVGSAGNAGDVTLAPSTCSDDTYSGGTTVGLGTLVLSCPVAAGSTASDAITVASNGVLQYELPTSGATVPNNLDLNGSLVDDTPGTLTSSGLVALSGTTTVSATSQATGIDFTNTVSGAGSLTVTDGGTPFTAVLSGTNTYSGTTTVTNVTLDVTGSFAGSTLTVGSGATVEGSGTIGGVAGNQGIVAPGTATTPGLLSAVNPVDFDPTPGAYLVTITGTTAGSGYSQLSSTSTVDVDGAALVVTDATTVPYGTVFTIVTSSASGSPVTGAFASLPAGTTFTTAGGRTLKIGYTANAVTLTDVTGSAPGTGTGPAPVTGYQLAGSNGGIYAFGGAPYEGSLPGDGVHVSNITAMTSTGDGRGYWLVGSDGGVFAFGAAAYEGSLPGDGVHVSDIVSIRATSDGKGYWLIGSDGGVFAFGDAAYEGSLPADGVHVSDIVAMRKAGDGGGYLLVGRDGGVFAFGAAAYEGSLPGVGVHVSDIVGVDTVQNGYVLVGADGGVFTFGQAAYEGSLPGDGVHVSDIVGIATDNSGLGYVLVGADGGVFNFGDIAYQGSLPGQGITVHDIVGIHDTQADT